MRKDGMRTVSRRLDYSDAAKKKRKKNGKKENYPLACDCDCIKHLKSSHVALYAVCTPRNAFSIVSSARLRSYSKGASGLTMSA